MIFLTFYFVLGYVCRLSHFSRVRLFATLQTVALQAPLSIGFSKQEYWSGLPCPSPGDLPDPGNKPVPLMSPSLAGGFFLISTTWEAPSEVHMRFYYIHSVMLVGWPKNLFEFFCDILWKNPKEFFWPTQ